MRADNDTYMSCLRYPSLDGVGAEESPQVMKGDTPRTPRSRSRPTSTGRLAKADSIDQPIIHADDLSAGEDERDQAVASDLDRPSDGARSAQARAPEETPELLTVSQVASYLNVSQSTVYRALENGRLPGTKPFGRWRVDRDELTQWLAAQRSIPRACRESDPMPRSRSRGGFRSQVMDLGPRRRA